MGAEESKSLLEACKMYEKFIKRALDDNINEEIVGNLRFLIENGNVTTYEWKYKEKPISIEENQLVFEEEEEDKEDTGDEIDFGDGGNGEIDFGDDGGEAEIDFGGDDEGEIDFGDTDIDFGTGEAG